MLIEAKFAGKNDEVKRQEYWKNFMDYEDRSHTTFFNLVKDSYDQFDLIHEEFRKKEGYDPRQIPDVFLSIFREHFKQITGVSIEEEDYIPEYALAKFDNSMNRLFVFSAKLFPEPFSSKFFPLAVLTEKRAGAYIDKMRDKSDENNKIELFSFPLWDFPFVEIEGGKILTTTHVFTDSILEFTERFLREYQGTGLYEQYRKRVHSKLVAEVEEKILWFGKILRPKEQKLIPDGEYEYDLIAEFGDYVWNVECKTYVTPWILRVYANPYEVKKYDEQHLKYTNISKEIIAKKEEELARNFTHRPVRTLIVYDCPAPVIDIIKWADVSYVDKLHKFLKTHVESRNTNI
jgi:hypothetical protein